MIPEGSLVTATMTGHGLKDPDTPFGGFPVSSREAWRGLGYDSDSEFRRATEKKQLAQSRWGF
jgi:hypothetical protein